MIQRKVLAGAGALALVAIALAACQEKKETAASEPAAASPPSPPPDPNAYPQWAFPGPLLKSVPGSDQKFSDVQMYDRTIAVDWFPNSHPAMPPAVKGRLQVYACGFCHLPEGAGRSENAALAGLPASYIVQQAADMKSGKRQPPDPKFGPAVNMHLTINQVSDAEIAEAAKYYASLKYTKHLKLVESDEVPHFSSNGFVYVIDKDGPKQPLGQRIVEGPDNFEGFEMRDPNMTFTAYVPTGSVAKGEALARGGGDRPACESCHGPGLKGGPLAPPIAGRLPTGLFRQIYAFKSGTRSGQGAALMKPVVQGLSNPDMIALAAYVASLEP